MNVDILNDQLVKERNTLHTQNRGYIHSHEYTFSFTQKQQ